MDIPTVTDFGAPIVSGPFTKIQEAKAWNTAHEESAGIYYETLDNQWYCHGPRTGDDGTEIPLTTYN